MGYFTWTFANKKLSKNQNGDYSRSCVLGYGSKGYICCPDGSFVEEKEYEGYGIFGGYDIYDLVVNWNKKHLVEICRTLPGGMIGGSFKDAPLFAEAYQNDDNEKLQELIKQKPFFGEEWKRTLGIVIAHCDSNNEQLPFPIKITSTDHPSLSYAELPISHTCQ